MAGRGQFQERAAQLDDLLGAAQNLEHLAVRHTTAILRAVLSGFRGAEEFKKARFESMGPDIESLDSDTESVQIRISITDGTKESAKRP